MTRRRPPSMRRAPYRERAAAAGRAAEGALAASTVLSDAPKMSSSLAASRSAVCSLDNTTSSADTSTPLRIRTVSAFAHAIMSIPSVSALKSTTPTIVTSRILNPALAEAVDDDPVAHLHRRLELLLRALRATPARPRGRPPRARSYLPSTRKVSGNRRGVGGGIHAEEEAHLALVLVLARHEAHARDLAGHAAHPGIRAKAGLDGVVLGENGRGLVVARERRRRRGSRRRPAVRQTPEMKTSPV